MPTDNRGDDEPASRLPAGGMLNLAAGLHGDQDGGEAGQGRRNLAPEGVDERQERQQNRGPAENCSGKRPCGDDPGRTAAACFWDRKVGSGARNADDAGEGGVGGTSGANRSARRDPESRGREFRILDFESRQRRMHPAFRRGVVATGLARTGTRDRRECSA